MIHEYILNQDRVTFEIVKNTKSYHVKETRINIENRYNPIVYESDIMNSIKECQNHIQEEVRKHHHVTRYYTVGERVAFNGKLYYVSDVMNSWDSNWIYILEPYKDALYDEKKTIWKEDEKEVTKLKNVQMRLDV